MINLNAIIVDDEINNINALKNTLKLYCPNVQVVATAQNITDAEKLINSNKPHVVFLDIEMPLGNGFDLLVKMMPINFDVIFVTAFNQYAVQAFKHSATDYLLKPIDPVELIAALKKVETKYNLQKDNTLIANLLQNIQTPNVLHKKIGIHTNDGVEFEEINDIIYLEASSNYTTIYLIKNKKITTPKILKDFEDMLPQQIFARIHSTYLININYIKKYHKGRGGYVEMENNASLEVAHRRKDEFLSKLKL